MRPRTSLVAISLLIGLSISACSETTVNKDNSSPFTIPTSPTAPVNKSALFEFRVTGNADYVRILYSTPTDGVVQVVTALPYQASFVSSVDSLFLTMSVTPISFPVQVAYPFISVQILVNGNVFRQATSDTAVSNPLEVSGTWRQNN